MDEQLEQLFLRYLQGQCQPVEVELVIRMLRMDEHDAEWKAAIARLSAEVMEGTAEAGISPDQSEVLKQRLLHSATPPTRLKPRFNWIYTAAAILLVATATALYFQTSLFVNRTSTIVNQEIKPGGNRATLTLANGTKINLDSAKAGIQINDEEIVYNDGTTIKAASRNSAGSPLHSDIHHSSPITYNSLTTPKGGQYQIILSDGTKVWLNAASTLKYPSRFSGNTREVFLEGEGYFEVAKSGPDRSGSTLRSEKAPFIVKSQNQEITVLGTSFNVNAFADEKSTKTTLIEGKVQVRAQNLTHKTYNPDKSGQALQLWPKQQATLSGDSLTVKTVDIESETAWRNGLFSFRNENIQSVMKKLSRWYNVDVEYRGTPSGTFNGEIGRDLTLQQVLKGLAATRIHYQIENGHTLVILP